MSNFVSSLSTFDSSASSSKSTPYTPSANRAAAFPNEVNAFIFDELSDMDASGTLASCALVCKMWLPFVRATLYRHPSEPLPLRLYGSEEREWWIDEFKDGQLCRLVEALESEEFGSLVKILDVNADLGYGRFRTRMEDVIPELSAILPWLVNCDTLNLKGLSYPKLDQLFLAITNAIKPIKHLSLALSLRSNPRGIPERTIINIPRYLARRDRLDYLKHLTSLKMRWYGVTRVLWEPEDGEWCAWKKEFEKTCPPPSWSLSSLELIRCSITDPEFPVLFGKPRGKLQHIRFQRCSAGLSADLLLSIVCSHTPNGGLTSLALIRTEFIDRSKPSASTIIEKIVQISPNLTRLELEGKLQVSDQFLNLVIPNRVAILRIVPFDQSLPGTCLGQAVEGEGDIFPRGFAPLDWQRYLHSPQSLSLRSLTIARSRNWTEEEVQSLIVSRQRVSIDVLDPVNYTLFELKTIYDGEPPSEFDEQDEWWDDEEY